MHICEYGCGQEAKFLFKNGKWCCVENYQSCPVNRKKERKIIEGVSLVGYMYIKKTSPTSIKMWKQPVIILEKSALQGSIDAYKRGKQFSILKNFKVFMKQLNKFKQDRPNIPGSVVENFDIPNIK